MLRLLIAKMQDYVRKHDTAYFDARRAAAIKRRELARQFTK